MSATTETLLIKIRDRQRGRVSVAELENLVKQGSFCREDLIWDQEVSDWVRADETPVVMDLFFPPNGKNGHLQAELYAVASGKGGVGKTMLTSSMGIALAAMGEVVILVDADFGGANLHTCLGMLEPRFTLFDYYASNEKALKDIALPTPVEHLRLISGACGALGLANPTDEQKQRFIQDVKKLPAAKVILDLGAGSSLDNIELFLLADEKIIVITPQPTSIYEAFGFLKVCLLHALNDALADFPVVQELFIEEKINRPEKMQLTLAELMAKVASIDETAASRFQRTLQAFRPKMILNMVQNKDDIKEGMAFQLAATELLSIDLEYLGYVSVDPMVTEAVKSTKPLLLLAPECKAAQDLSALIRLKLLGQKGLKGAFQQWRGQRHLRNYSKEYPQLNGLKNAPICSVNCFYWDNCEYQDGGLPCRVRHLEPVLRENDGYRDNPKV